MSSDNPSGADNQQERLFTIGWLVGFVDGEGCFSCPVFETLDDPRMAGATRICRRARGVES